MSLTYIHLNRLIKKYDLNAIFLAGPGHGAPALLSNVYLEGTYSEIYVPDQKSGPDHCEKKPRQDRPDHAKHLP
jgi:xylulose-5-phosphate/fructose-6-phosphate phosphoketolase